MATPDPAAATALTRLRTRLERLRSVHELTTEEMRNLEAEIEALARSLVPDKPATFVEAEPALLTQPYPGTPPRTVAVQRGLGNLIGRGDVAAEDAAH